MTLTEFLDQKIQECKEEAARAESGYKRGFIIYEESKRQRLQAANDAWKEIKNFCLDKKIDPEHAKEIVFQPLYAAVGIHVQKVPVRYYPGVEKKTESLYYIYGLQNIESLFNDNDPIGKTFNFKLSLNMGDENVAADYLFEVKEEDCDLEKKGGSWEGWKCFNGCGKLEGYYWADASLNIREHEGKLRSVAVQKTYLDETDPIWKKRAAHPAEDYWWVGFNEEVPDELDIPEGEFYYDETKDERM